MKRVKKAGALLLSAALVLGLCGCTPKQEQQAAFDAFMHRQFVETVQSDYLTAHILLENPQDYGVDMTQIDVRIGTPLSETDAAEQRADLADVEAEFARFRRSELTAEQQDTYDIFAFLLQTSMMASNTKFDGYPNYFETMTGIHTQLPTLFADLTLRDEQDVKDCIQLVQSVQPYIQSLLDYTQKQADNGTLMVNLDEVIAHCQEIVEAGMDSAVLHSLQTNIDGVEMDAAQREIYKQQMEQAFADSFLPAYQAIIGTMDSLREKPNNTQGLAHLPEGKAYYELLVRQNTGTTDSIRHIRTQLEQLANEQLVQIQRIVRAHPEAYTAWAAGETRTGYTDYAEMLTDLEQFTKQNFPDVGTFDYAIEPIDKEIATGGIAAYFNIPALDGTTPQQIRVNTTSTEVDVQSLSTFSTVAHEGFPGHMYQMRYAYQHIQEPYRNGLASFSGYTEGYATYVEFLALDYLTDVDESVRQLETRMGIFEHCLTALMDIGIHYDGWSKADLRTFFIQNGLNTDVVDVLYDQLQANPGAFLPYYVGHMQFMRLRTEAETALGEQFDEKAFHAAILASGSAPFEVVERHVQAYIRQTKADKALLCRQQPAA